MRRLLVLAVQVLMLGALLSQTAVGQVTSNVLRRVLRVQTAHGEGTAFTLDVDGRQYVITAKHVVAGLAEDDNLNVRRNDKWESIHVKIFRCDDPIDIAIIVPPHQLTIDFPLEGTSAGMRYGQDVYFVGYPYGLSIVGGEKVNGLYPIPFIKKGIASANGGTENAAILYVDGNNNPGFSGAPIVYRDLDRTDWSFKVAAVVSGFRLDVTPVLQPVPIDRDQITAGDIANARIATRGNQLVRLTETGQVVQTNTGIILGWNISHAIDMIKKHPVGPKVTPQFEPSATQ